jgi:hypothetical protein
MGHIGAVGEVASMIPADERLGTTGGTVLRRGRFIRGALGLVLAACALEYTALWLPNMLNIAHTLNHQIVDSPSRDRVIQQAHVVVLMSLIPFLVTFLGAIWLGRAGLGAQGALPIRRIGLEKLTVWLFIAWVVCLVTRVLISSPSEFYATLLSVIGVAGYEVAAATLIVGGISLGRATGSRNQRTWQYLARAAFVLTSLFLVVALALWVIIILFEATFHLFD